MSGADGRDYLAVLDELANALQAAVGRAALLRHDVQAMNDDIAALDVTVRRAAAALRRLQPGGGTER